MIVPRSMELLSARVYPKRHSPSQWFPRRLDDVSRLIRWWAFLSLLTNDDRAAFVIHTLPILLLILQFVYIISKLSSSLLPSNSPTSATSFSRHLQNRKLNTILEDRRLLDSVPAWQSLSRLPHHRKGREHGHQEWFHRMMSSSCRAIILRWYITGKRSGKFVGPYGHSGFVGLFANSFVTLCAAFAAVGGIAFGYDQGVVSLILVMPQFLERFSIVGDNAPGAGF